MSALCTKWMQLNAGFERLDDIQFDSPADGSQKMTQNSANLFTMYSILDEMQLNDSPKPATSNIIATREPGFTGIGFISHIENELIGSVYMLDIQSMPDPVVLFGDQPKRLSELPQPGQMFGYVFQEKYLVRAVRSEYESYAVTNQTKKYSATLIDIGCVVRIDIKPTLPNHFEVTNVAKAIPPFAKSCQLIEIPPKTSLNDLLHTSVQYRVICVDEHLTFVSILNKGSNPFAAENQKQWHFYMYFLGNHMKTPTSSSTLRIIKNSSAFQSTTNKTVKRSSTKCDPNSNPFADSAFYQIESIPSKPMIDKSNPFYFDVIENLDTIDKPMKAKFLNVRLTKFLGTKPFDDIDTNDDYASVTLAANKLDAKEENINGKISNAMNSMPLKTTAPVQVCKPAPKDVEIESNLQQNHGMIDKLAVNSGRSELPSSLNAIKNHVNEYDVKVAIKQMTPSKPAMPVPSSTLTVSLEQQTPVTTPQMAKPTAPHKKSDFAAPKYVPTIGEKIKILYQTMENVEKFYAVIVDDATRVMQVHEFALLLNDEENTNNLIQYNDKCTPKLYDTVMAEYEGLYYRAKVIEIIDSHAYKVFFVDYGNSAKVCTLQMCKYDNKWDAYPVYALHFRLNGIRETNSFDYTARAALQQIMIADCEATIVGIERCEKTNRTTYVVDVRDENGLNVAEILVHKNLALYTGKRANHPTPVRQSKHA